MPSKSALISLRVSAFCRIGRVERVRVDAEGAVACRRPHRDRRATPDATPSAASRVMNVAKPSLSQMSSHHFIVTRSPNHWCAISCAMTPATPRFALDRRVLVVEEERGLAERDRAGVLHRARFEVGNADQVELPERILDAVVLVVKRDRRLGGADTANLPRFCMPGTEQTRIGMSSTPPLTH